MYSWKHLTILPVLWSHNNVTKIRCRQLHKSPISLTSISKISESCKDYYYVAEFMSGQDKVNPVFLLATEVGKMGPSFPLGIFRFVPVSKSSVFGHTISPLLTKLVRSRWQNIGLVFFAFLLTSNSSRSTKKQTISSHLNLTLGQ